MHAAINLTYGLTLDDDVEHAAKLDQVDAQALAQFAAEFFDAKRQVRLIVQPQD